MGLIAVVYILLHWNRHLCLCPSHNCVAGRVLVERDGFDRLLDRPQLHRRPMCYIIPAFECSQENKCGQR